MTFSNYQLVTHTPTNRTGRIINKGNHDTVIVMFSTGEEIIYDAQTSLTRKSEKTAKMMVRSALRNYRHSKNFSDLELINLHVDRYIDRQISRHKYLSSIPK